MLGNNNILSLSAHRKEKESVAEDTPLTPRIERGISIISAAAVAAILATYASYFLSGEKVDDPPVAIKRPADHPATRIADEGTKQYR